MPKLILIRHGQSQWNLENRFTGWWDVDLTAKGEEEARAAYLANYEPGWTGLGAISSMPVDAFKAWAFDGKKKRKPLVYVAPEVTATEEDSASADPREAYADEKVVLTGPQRVAGQDPIELMRCVAEYRSRVIGWIWTEPTP